MPNLRQISQSWISANKTGIDTSRDAFTFVPSKLQQTTKISGRTIPLTLNLSRATESQWTLSKCATLCETRFEVVTSACQKPLLASCWLQALSTQAVKLGMAGRVKALFRSRSEVFCSHPVKFDGSIARMNICCTVDVTGVVHAETAAQPSLHGKARWFPMCLSSNQLLLILNVVCPTKSTARAKFCVGVTQQCWVPFLQGWPPPAPPWIHWNRLCCHALPRLPLPSQRALAYRRSDPLFEGSLIVSRIFCRSGWHFGSSVLSMLRSFSLKFLGWTGKMFGLHLLSLHTQQRVANKGVLLPPTTHQKVNIYFLCNADFCTKQRRSFVQKCERTKNPKDAGVSGPEHDHTTRSCCSPEISGPQHDCQGLSSNWL